LNDEEPACEGGLLVVARAYKKEQTRYLLLFAVAFLLAVALRVAFFLVAFFPAAFLRTGFLSLRVRALALTDETDRRSILAISVADFVRYACLSVEISAEDHAFAPLRTRGLFAVVLRVAFFRALRID
jgi:hypothetical protein